MERPHLLRDCFFLSNTQRSSSLWRVHPAQMEKWIVSLKSVSGVRGHPLSLISLKTRVSTQGTKLRQHRKQVEMIFDACDLILFDSQYLHSLNGLKLTGGRMFSHRRLHGACLSS